MEALTLHTHSIDVSWALQERVHMYPIILKKFIDKFIDDGISATEEEIRRYIKINHLNPRTPENVAIVFDHKNQSVEKLEVLDLYDRRISRYKAEMRA